MNLFAKFGRQHGEHGRRTSRQVMGLMLAGAALLVFGTLITCNTGFVTSTTSSPAFPLWVSTGLVRVGKTDAPGTTSSVSLFGARGETVDTQVIVQAPSGGLSNVNVSASPLTAPGGATIPASNVTLYREHYVAVTGTANYGGGSNPPLGSGTYPEPLIPFNDPETAASLCGSAGTLKACTATIPGA